MKPTTKSPMNHHTVTLLPGDGVGPEIMKALQHVVAASGVTITWDEQLAGAKAFEQGIASGVPEATLASIAAHGVAVKGPLETPVGFGSRSANVTLRKIFETYGNIRPAKEIPGLVTPFTGRGIDLTIVRENVEDLYAGMEYDQTPSVAESLKLITEHGTERICRLAFAVALSQGCTTVHCATKANILKLTEGLFKRVFEEVAKDYPTITAKHMIIDNCAHQLVVNPEQFQVIVMSNLHGDIISDLASGLIGGLGVAPSANLGQKVAIFESVHGSAPDIAGKDIVNPTAMLFTGCMLLRHLSEFAAAQLIEEALITTLQQGLTLTADLAHQHPPVGTQAFAQAVVANFGQKPEGYSYGTYHPLTLPPQLTVTSRHDALTPVGVDVFIQPKPGITVPDLDSLADQLQKLHPGFTLAALNCRGVQVWPAIPYAQTELVDHLCCRFMATNDVTSENLRSAVPALLQHITSVAPWMHVELLQTLNGKPRYN